MRALNLLAVLSLLVPTLSQAHHSFAAEFDGTKPVRLVGTITRIVYFIGVGLLLLLIGYLAPVPPRKEVTP